RFGRGKVCQESMPMRIFLGFSSHGIYLPANSQEENRPRVAIHDEALRVNCLRESVPLLPRCCFKAGNGTAIRCEERVYLEPVQLASNRRPLAGKGINEIDHNFSTPTTPPCQQIQAQLLRPHTDDPQQVISPSTAEAPGWYPAS